MCACREGYRWRGTPLFICTMYSPVTHFANLTSDSRPTSLNLRVAFPCFFSGTDCHVGCDSKDIEVTERRRLFRAMADDTCFLLEGDGECAEKMWASRQLPRFFIITHILHQHLINVDQLGGALCKNVGCFTGPFSKSMSSGNGEDFPRIVILERQSHQTLSLFEIRHIRANDHSLLYSGNWIK